MSQLCAMTPARNPLRKAVLLRAQRGDYATAIEVATVASVSRRTAIRWLDEAGIDLKAARLKYLSKLYVIGQEQLARLRGAPRLSAADKHKQMVDAVRRLNAAQVQRSVKKSG